MATTTLTIDVAASPYTWVCPTGVTSINVMVRGGGGGGGGLAADTNKSSGGGAGGQVALKAVTVVPGASYTIVIGAGGTAGADTGGNGADLTNYKDGDSSICCRVYQQS